MRFLCDVHIPYRPVKYLGERGADATQVNRILDQWYTKDQDIARYVDATDTVLVTKDGDFRDSHFLRGTPVRVVRVTLGNISNEMLVSLFDRHWDDLQAALTYRPCYVELGQDGLRNYREPI